jgi:heme-degrading monooxygenase HmoA
MYYAVIFTSTRTEIEAGYAETAIKMLELAKVQPGFMGVESARNEIGITVSYWESLEAIQKWKTNMEHLQAQENGRATWYKNYKVRIAKVEREYEF